MNNKRYQATLASVVAYAFDRNNAQADYFPVILMNSAFETFINNRVPQDKSILSQLPGSLVNNNVKLRTTIEPSRSFIFDELTPETLDENVHSGSVYNRQRMGLTVKNFNRESLINKRYQIVATFNSAP